MDDLGVQYTDKKVEALEKKLAKAYKQASKEIGEKLKDFTEKSAAKESKYLQMVKDGTMTQDAFDKWKQGQVFYGDAWKSQQRNMAKVLADTNKTATAWINGEKADVFAFNGNYTAYDMEHGFGVNFGFDLYSEDSVKHLLKDNPKILPKSSLSISKDEKWNMRNIRSQITQGILQGESIPKIADRLANLIPERNRNQMVLHARTAMTSAQNAGRQERYKEAEALGIKFKKVWLATLDARTRETHQDADGQAVKPDEDFVVGGEKLAYPGDPSADPAETYNCFVGETNVVTNCNVERVYHHKYEGQLISIKTAGGVNFTCTPNHPILTRRGWVHAQFLNKGDDIVVTFRSHDWFSWIDPNINHRFPRFDTLFKLFDKMGGKRTCALGVDFHGDIATSNVEIITQERLLGDNGNSGKFKKESKLGFVLPDKSLACNSTLMKHFRGIFCSSFCFIRRFCKMLSFFWRGLTHSEIHSLRPIALFDSCGIKPWNDSCSCDAKLLGELLDGFSGIVCGDKIVNIDICSSDCHVYNLQSKYGYYFVNSISQNKSKYNDIVAIAKNCRCTMVTELDDYPSSFDRRAYDTDDSGHRESYITKDTTYKEWLKGKQGGSGNTSDLDERIAKRFAEVKKEYSQNGTEYGARNYLPVTNPITGEIEEHSYWVNKEKDYEFPDGTYNGVYQKRDADVYMLENGTVFVQPSDLDRNLQGGDAEFFMERYFQLPEDFRDQIQKRIIIVDYRNPQDSSWAKKYKMKNFRSYATGGRDITFYASDTHDADYVVNSLAHEGGHYIDLYRLNAERTSESKEWAKAMRADEKISGLKGVSSYAQVHKHEDFAESLAEYVTNNDNLKTNFPNRYKILDEMVGGK